MEDLAQWARHDAAGLQRAGELAEVPVELRDAGEHVVEAPGRALAVGVEYERVDLVAHKCDLRAEGQDVLNRPVVEVEPDPHEALLARAHEHLLPLGRALEQELALEDRRERGACCRQVGIGPRDGLEHAGHDGCARRPEAAHEARAERPRPEQAQRRPAPERRLRGRARPAALGAVPECEDHVDVPAVASPERRLGGDPELEQEPELDLGGDERRELVEHRARAGSAVQVEPRGLDRLVANLGEGLDGDLHVRRIELALGGQGDDDARHVGAGREPVGCLRLAGTLEGDQRPAVGRPQEEMDARLGLGQQDPMRGLEPRSAARRRRERRGVPSRGLGRTALRPDEGRHQPSIADRVIKPLIMQEPPPCRRDAARFPLFVTIPASGACLLGSPLGERVLDRFDDTVRVVPLGGTSGARPAGARAGCRRRARPRSPVSVPA